MRYFLYISVIYGKYVIYLGACQAHYPGMIDSVPLRGTE